MDTEKGFLYRFGKAMRSIVAFIVIMGGFLYMFIYPDKSKTELITIMMVVVGYYFTSNKDQSDQQKARIALDTNNTTS